MDTKKLFAREFEKFSFKEIHRNPPKSLIEFKKPKISGGFISGGFGGILAGGITLGHDIFTAHLPKTGKDDIEEELEEELKKREPNFYDYLVAYMDEKDIDNEAELYKKAEVNRATYSKIRSMRKTNYRPSKPTVIKLCLALELDEEQTQEMLHTVGYGMSNSSLVDKIIMFFIKHKIYDIFEIDDAIHDKTNQKYLVDDL